MVYPFTPLKPLQDFWLFIQAIGRKQNGDRPSDHFLGRVSEDSFRRLVPAMHDAIEIFADDSVIRRSDDGGKQRLRFRERACLGTRGSAHRDSVASVVKGNRSD